MAKERLKPIKLELFEVDTTYGTDRRRARLTVMPSGSHTVDVQRTRKTFRSVVA
jgi:hypothetical protein